MSWASSSTKKWLATHGITVFPHPASSPDVNPIEPAWHDLKDIICALPHPPSTIAQLREAALAAWEEIPVEKVTKYIRTMPERVQAIIDAKGGHTPF